MKTVITGVSWHRSRSSQVSKEGLFTAQNGVIRVPDTADTQRKRYIDVQQLSKDGYGEYWTAAPKDKVVLGEVMGEPTDDTLPTWLEKNGYTVLTVNEVTDNRRKPLPHIRIGGC